MKDLPSVTAFTISEKLNNCQERYYESNSPQYRKSNPVNINKKINDIFKSNNHVYKSRVLIDFGDYEEEKTVVGKTATELITITGERIKILSIKNIEKI